MGNWLEQEVLRLADQVERDDAERRLADHLRRQERLQAEVRAVLDENPGATANAVCKALKGRRLGRRADILLAVQRVRESGTGPLVPPSSEAAA